MKSDGTNRLIKFILSIVQFIPICVIAVALKAHYSCSGADGLRWMLAPTARCVELLAAVPFAYERDIGYCNRQHRAIIAPPCAGINFMIVVYCMTAVMVAGRQKKRSRQMLAVASCLPLSWCVTIIVNAVRITLALHLYDYGTHFGWFNQDRVHRLLGVAVYFTALCGIYAIVKRRTPMGAVNREWRYTISSILIPLAWYLAVTLAVPLLLGKYSLYGERLFEHALFLLLVPAVMLIVGMIFNCCHSLLYNKLLQSKNRSG